MARRLVVATLVLVAIVAQPVAAAAGPATHSHDASPGAGSSLAALQTGPDTRQGYAASTDDDIIRTMTFSLTPAEPGSVDVELAYDVPDTVVELETSVPDSATVEETVGFEADDSGTYVWDGDTPNPTVNFSMPANRTGAYQYDRGPVGQQPGSAQSGSGPGSGPRLEHDDLQGLLFADTGSWALVSVPPVSVSWSYRGEPAPGVVRQVATDGEGVAGQQMVYLGPHTSETRTIDDQRVTLVVPDAATLEPSASAVFESIEEASASLQVGTKPDRMVLFAAPTAVEWGPFGLARGADAWIRADQPLDDPNNVWLHEYVHILQDFETTKDARWTREAMGEYYAALLTLQQGRIGFETFRAHLEAGTDTEYEETVLSQPETWTNLGNYVKGGLVFGSVDRQLRLATDGREPASHLVRAMNEREEPVDHEFLLETVGRLADDETAAYLDRYATTDRSPEMWTRSEHSAAFSRLPPRIVTDVSRPIAISGPYRNQTVEEIPVLAPGEQVTIDVTLENVGDAAGDYRTELLVDGDPVAVENGTLDGGSATNVTLNYTASATGPVELGVDSRTWNVTVSDPAEPTVTAVTVSDDEVRVGDSVGVSVTVTNSNGRPAAGNISLWSEDETVTTWTQRLAPGATVTRAEAVSFDEPGEYVIRAGTESATVTVTAESKTETGTPEETRTDDTKSRTGDQTRTTLADGGGATGPVETPGLGFVGAAVGLLLAIVLARHRGLGGS